MAEIQTKRIAVSLDLTWYLKRHTDVFAGIAKYAAQREDWRCVIDDFAEDTLARDSQRKKSYDAIIGRVTAPLAEISRRRRLPLVNVWLGSPVKGLFGVYPDFAQAGVLAAEHMVSRGMRRLACVYRRGDIGETAFANHFKEFTNEAGCACDLIPVAIRFSHSAANWTKTRRAIAEWLGGTAAPMGVAATIDILGRHIAQIASALGFIVPQDVAIVSAHNEPTVCLYPEPALTSIEYGYDHLGHEAAGVLDLLLEGKPPDEKTMLVPPRELIVRRSSDFTYIDDEMVSAAMQYIAQNSHKSIGVADVAIAARASRRALELRFSNRVGRSVAAEIRRVRIDHAKRLLAGTEMLVSQIARTTGFGTSHQMARVFRREVGMSPGEYREQFTDQ